MAENQQRQSDLRPSCARLKCLRCRAEVTCQKEGGEQQEEGEIRRRMRKALMLTGGEEEQDEEEETDRAADGRGEGDGRDDHLKSNFCFLEFSYVPHFSELSAPD